MKVVIDNDSLAHLTYIDSQVPILNTLRTLFHSIHVPDEVYNEFQKHIDRNPERNKALTMLQTPNKFLRKCTDFDILSKSFLETFKKIDKGEASVAAQYQKIGARFMISEDNNFHKEICSLYPNVTVIKVKHLLALLDMHQLIDWNTCISLLYQRRKFNSAELKAAYVQSAQHLGVSINKRQLSEKCSIKKLVKK